MLHASLWISFTNTCLFTNCLYIFWWFDDLMIFFAQQTWLLWKRIQKCTCLC
jgi:hypothetical protein